MFGKTNTGNNKKKSEDLKEIAEECDWFGHIMKSSYGIMVHTGNMKYV